MWMNVFGHKEKGKVKWGEINVFGGKWKEKAWMEKIEGGRHRGWPTHNVLSPAVGQHFRIIGQKQTNGKWQGKGKEFGVWTLRAFPSFPLQS
jgi:hypothetical protein